MKKSIVIFAVTTASFITSIAWASPMTNEVYFEVRRQLRKEDVSEFKAQKVCERIKGQSVELNAKVVAVKKSGIIRLDMDDDFFSIPDIDLSLSDKDDAENVKEKSWIKFTGQVEKCNFNKTTGSLTLDVTSGEVKKQ